MVLPSVRPGIQGGAVPAFILSRDGTVDAMCIARLRISALPRRVWGGIHENAASTLAAAAVMPTAVTIAATALSLVLGRPARAQAQAAHSGPGDLAWTSS